MATEITQTEKNFRALAKLSGLNVRKINSCGTFELSMGAGPVEVGSYGISSVIRYTAWTDTYTVPGFVGDGEIRREDVAIYLAIWTDNRSVHPTHREYLLRCAVAA